MHYKEIRKYSPIKIRELYFSEILCMLVSPFFTKYFLKRKIRPNTVTLLMVFCGLLGPVLFALPWLSAKWIGVICLWGWFIMDCSDGEVARITKTFSKYGKEMDYMAHLICHPLLNLAIYITFSSQVVNELWLACTAIVFISSELIIRSLTAINSYTVPHENSSPLPSLPKYFLQQFLYYPNFVLFFPFFMLLTKVRPEVAFCLYLIWCFIYTLSTCRALCRMLKYFYWK